jgi:multicomponent Na+:H+ antiporter subunit D
VNLLPMYLVFAPLLGAISAYLSPRFAAPIAMFVTMLGVAVGLVLFTNIGVDGWSMALAGWDVPLGIAWRIDGLSATLLLLCWVLGAGISVYALGYFRTETAFWPLLLLLLSGCSALFMANDLFNIYVMLEILGLTAVALVALANNSEALKAALTYLFVGLFGSLCYLAGVALLYTQYGVLDITLLGAMTLDEPLTWIACALMALGLLLKSAIFPLHFWLPGAHSNAPAPVSALLSALVVKASFFVLLRLWSEVVPSTPEILGLMLGLVGATAIIWGSYQALRTPRLKLLVAYSTVAQLGYLMLLFPLSMTATNPSSAYAGVVYFMVAHGLAKSALFMVAGNLQRVAGHDRIADLKHAAVILQPSLFAVALAGASIMGLPPSGGFIAKWTLLSTSLSSGEWGWVVMLLGGGLMSVTYIFRILVLAFQDDAQAPTNLPPERSVTRSMQFVPLILGAFAIALGFNATPIIEAITATQMSLSAGAMQ